MLQNACKTLGFKKNMVYKIPPGGGGKPYPASGLIPVFYLDNDKIYEYAKFDQNIPCSTRVENKEQGKIFSGEA